MLSNNLIQCTKKYLIKISKIILLSNILLNINLKAQTWEIINPIFSDGDSLNGIVDIPFNDKNNGWMFKISESNGPIKEFYKKIYKTEDGGNNWVLKKSELSSEFYVQKIYSLNSNNLIALYVSPNESLLISNTTNDNGETWVSNKFDNSGVFQTNIMQINMFNNLDGIAISNIAWFTHDGGNSWVKKNDILNKFLPPKGLCFVNDSIGWMIGPSYYATDAGYIAKTTDGGKTWNYQDSITSILFGCDFINLTSGFVVGTNLKFGTGYIYNTENSGVDWKLEKFVGAQVFWDVGFLDEKNGWITGVGKILKTTDGGKSWETQIEGLLTNLNKIQILKEEKVAYILGNDFNNRTNTLIKADLSTISDIKNKEIISNEFSLLQNYPNPFNSSTKIYFNLNQKRNIQLKIFDLLGKEVITLINEDLFAGNYDIEWNGKNNQGDEVTSGIYFYKIITDVSIAGKKMILLK